MPSAVESWDACPVEDAEEPGRLQGALADEAHDVGAVDGAPEDFAGGAASEEGDESRAQGDLEQDVRRKLAHRWRRRRRRRGRARAVPRGSIGGYRSFEVVQLHAVARSRGVDWLKISPICFLLNKSRYFPEKRCFLK